MTAEQLANRFHDLYEEMASQYGYETRRDSSVEWENVPDNNKQLMIAVCRRILEENEFLSNRPEIEQ